MPTTGSASLLTSAASFTPFDWIILGLVLWSVVRGFIRGLIRELFALAALLIGITLAAWNYTALSTWLARWIPQPTSASIAAFLLLTLGVTLSVLLTGRLVRSAAHLVGLGLLDRVAGALFGLTRACLLGAAILVACLTFLPPQPWMQHSQLTPTLLSVGHTAARLAPSGLGRRISEIVAALPQVSR